MDCAIAIVPVGTAQQRAEHSPLVEREGFPFRGVSEMEILDDPSPSSLGRVLKMGSGKGIASRLGRKGVWGPILSFESIAEGIG